MITEKDFEKFHNRPFTDSDKAILKIALGKSSIKYISNKFIYKIIIKLIKHIKRQDICELLYVLISISDFTVVSEIRDFIDKSSYVLSKKLDKDASEFFGQENLEEYIKSNESKIDDFLKEPKNIKVEIPNNKYSS